jgi:hypothetical protein
VWRWGRVERRKGRDGAGQEGSLEEIVSRRKKRQLRLSHETASRVTLRLGAVAQDGKVVTFIPEIASDANMPEDVAADFRVSSVAVELTK